MRVTPEPIPGSAWAAALQREGLGSKQHKILLMLAAYADAGETSPTIGQIARYSKEPRVAVIGCLRKLEGRGLIEVEWATQPNQRNVYRLVTADINNKED